MKFHVLQPLAYMYNVYERFVFFYTNIYCLSLKGGRSSKNVLDFLEDMFPIRKGGQPRNNKDNPYYSVGSTHVRYSNNIHILKIDVLFFLSSLWAEGVGVFTKNMWQKNSQRFHIYRKEELILILIKMASESMGISDP